MKFKKIAFLLFLPFLAEIVISCCNCVDPLIQRYTNKSFTVNNLDNRGSAPVVTSSNSIVKMAYGIRLAVKREKTACITLPASFLTQSAYAKNCNCPPDKEFLPQDSIISIKIFTLRNFDNRFPANSDISEYFKVFKQTSFAQINNHIGTLNDKLFDEQAFNTSVDFLLLTPPNNAGPHKFRVQVILSDGRIIEAETAEVSLI